MTNANAYDTTLYHADRWTVTKAARLALYRAISTHPDWPAVRAHTGKWAGAALKSDIIEMCRLLNIYPADHGAQLRPDDWEPSPRVLAMNMAKARAGTLGGRPKSAQLVEPDLEAIREAIAREVRAQLGAFVSGQLVALVQQVILVTLERRDAEQAQKEPDNAG